MYDPRQHEELRQRVKAAWKAFDDIQARTAQLLRTHGKSSPEYQQALFGDTTKALEAAHDAASELEAYEVENNWHGGSMGEPVEVNPRYEHLNPGNGILHEYQFVVELRSLGMDVSSGRLLIYWPDFLPVAIEPLSVSSQGFEKKNGIDCLVLEFATPPIRAGQAILAIGGDAGPRLRYRVDDMFYRQHVRPQKDREVLWWQLTLDDGGQQNGSRAMSQIQNF